MNGTSIKVLLEPACENSTLHQQCIAGLGQGAAQQRAKIRLYHSVMGLQAEADIRIAVIVSANLDWTREVANALRQDAYKVILVGPAVEALGESFSGPTLNRDEMVRRMLQYFISAGRTRVACVGNETFNINDQTRVEAFISGAKFLGLSVSAYDVYDANEGLGLCIERFLDKSARYDGAICVNDYVAIELLAQAHQRGITVPDELFVAGSGDFRMGRITTPTLTTTTLDYHKMGLVATDIWQLMQKYKDADRIRVSLPCELIIRQSTDSFEPSLRTKLAVVSQNLKIGAKEDSTADFLRKLESCLLSCDTLDIQILKGVFSNQSIAQMAEKLFVSMGTVNYRLRQLYQLTGIGQKTVLMHKLRKYITSETALEQMVNI